MVVAKNLLVRREACIVAEENVQKLKASTRISIPFTKRVFFGVRETELAHTKSFAVTLFSLLLLLKMQRDVQIFQKNKIASGREYTIIILYRNARALSLQLQLTVHLS